MFGLTYFEVFMVWFVVTLITTAVIALFVMVHEGICSKSKKPLEVYRVTLNMVVAVVFGVACGTYIVKHKPVSISIPSITIQNSTITSEAADRLLKGRTLSEAATQSRQN